MEENFEQELIGKPLDKVYSLCEKAGRDVRVMHEDGLNYIGTSDYKPTRANLTVHRGIVTEVSWG